MANTAWMSEIRFASFSSDASKALFPLSSDLKAKHRFWENRTNFFISQVLLGQQANSSQPGNYYLGEYNGYKLANWPSSITSIFCSWACSGVYSSIRHPPWCLTPTDLLTQVQQVSVHGECDPEPARLWTEQKNSRHNVHSFLKYLIKQGFFFLQSTVSQKLKWTKFFEENFLLSKTWNIEKCHRQCRVHVFLSRSDEKAKDHLWKVCPQEEASLCARINRNA